jgi:hypothetical protein
MGIETGTALLIGAGLVAGTAAGTAGYSALQAKQAADDQKGPKELEAKAAREAEKRRLASASKLSTQGETMFTSPLGMQGGTTPLKGKLGL